MARADRRPRDAVRARRDRRAHRDPGLDELHPFLQPISLSGADGLTLANYTAIFTDPNLSHALVNTLVISLLTATLTAGSALWLALAATRGGRAGRALFDLSFLVFAIPSVVLGMAVLFLYLYLPIPVYGTVWIIVIALTTRYIPGVRA
ncbi:hypothetical protein NKH77_05375 [Streptomyces sp. M19]